ncbi:MAG: L-aspartate oxidase, partial [Terriglobales bacterium]
EFEFSLDLCLSGGAVRGVSLMDAKGGVHQVGARAVLLASGGLGQVYRETTNPGVATGDGVAMAFRPGAAISDMEFVQFHPTALYLKGAPRFLLSEALRGEGAYLRNAETLRFMPKYHEMGELAPRDVVARAIVNELEISPARDPVVYLDMTHLDAEKLRARFPRIHATCMKYNLDIATDLVPVRPAAHYAMGGVRTDLEGRTNLKGLYAAGEVAATGVHGANRLASNSLLEGLVYGARSGIAMREDTGPIAAPKGRKTSAAASRSKHAVAAKPGPHSPTVEDFIRELREAMWKGAGIVRSGDSLRKAMKDLEQLQSRLPPENSRRTREAVNLLQTGLLIVRSALAREESRGAHYRIDFPAHNDAKFRKHSVVVGETLRFE